MLVSNQQIHDCTITGCNKISADVYLVTLEAPKNTTFNFQPGQYLFIHMAEDDARPYSIASIPSDSPKLEMHIRDIPDNDFSGQVLQKLNNEPSIRIRLPAGECTIDRSDGKRPLLFIAGGTGYAPCHSIIQALIEADDSRPISLYWGANDIAEFYFLEQPEKWQKEHDNFNFKPVILHHNHNWSGETGMVHEAVFRNINKLSAYDIYLSGSSAMVFNIYRQLREKDVPTSQIFSDMLDILRE